VLLQHRHAPAAPPLSETITIICALSAARPQRKSGCQAMRALRVMGAGRTHRQCPGCVLSLSPPLPPTSSSVMIVLVTFYSANVAMPYDCPLSESPSGTNTFSCIVGSFGHGMLGLDVTGSTINSGQPADFSPAPQAHLCERIGSDQC